MKTGSRYFLGIGIDQYLPENKIGDLKNSKADIKRLTQVLEKRYGFKQLRSPLLDEDATYANIHRALEESWEWHDDEDATLLIYFAGHGIEQPRGKGHWVPYDSTGKLSDTISHEAILNYVRMNQWAKHIIVISDSCFSGSLTDEHFPLRPNMGNPKKLSSRIAISAGRLEPVGDGAPGFNSPFSKTLCSYLEANTKPAVSIYQVIGQIKKITPSRSYQTPLATEIDSFGNEHGEFLFELDRNSAPRASGPLAIPTHLVQSGYIARTLARRTVVGEFTSQGIGFQGYSLNEAIESHNHIVVIGEAGSGKSRELIETARYMEDYHSYLVPTFQSLASLSPGLLMAQIEHRIGIDGEQRSIFFLDSLDEVSPENFEATVITILDLTKRYPMAKIIVSCRKNIYLRDVERESIDLLPGFLTLEVDNLEYEGIIALLGAEGINADEFFQQVQINHFTDLIGKPYSLFQLIANYKKHHNLNVARWLLNEQTLVEGGVLVGTPIERLVKGVAFALSYSGGVFITQQELEELGYELPILDQQSILVRDNDTGKWSFTHKNLQEFLCAKHLSELSFEALIKLVSEERLVGRGINPLWVNILTFLFSMCNEELRSELVGWLKENDPVSILKFEQERLNEDLRATLFQQLYNSYVEKDLWMMSNRYTVIDLGHLANNDSTISFIIDQLRNRQTTRIGLMNLVYILNYVDLSGKEEQWEEFKLYLARLVFDMRLDPSDRLGVVKLMIRKKMAAREFYDKVLTTYKSNDNAYNRAMIYNLIKDIEDAEAQVSYLLNGLQMLSGGISSTGRDCTNLGDEESGLFDALLTITSSAGIGDLIGNLLKDDAELVGVLSYHHREGFVKILDNFKNALNTDQNLLPTLIDLYIGIYKGYHYDLRRDCANVFISTGNDVSVLMDIWIKGDLDPYDLEQLSYPLLSPNGCQQIAESFVASEISVDRTRYFHRMLYDQRRNSPEYLSSFETTSIKRHDFRGDMPAEIDWERIRAERKDYGRILLTDPELIKGEVKGVFQIAGKNVLDLRKIGELSNTSFKSSQDYVHEFAFNLLYHIRKELKRDLSLDLVLNWLSNEKKLLFFQLERLDQVADLTPQMLNDTQLEYIRKAMGQFPGHDRLFWSLTRKGILEVDQPRLLDMSSQFALPANNQINAESQLEILEQYIGKDELQARVLTNLEDDSRFSVWINNAAYALRKQIIAAYDLIMSKLAEQGDRHQQDELIHFWIKVTNNYQSLKWFVDQTKSITLKIGVLRVISKAEQYLDFVQERAQALLAQGNLHEHERQRLVNILIEQDLGIGLNLLVEDLTAGRYYDVHYADFTKLTKIDFLPQLLTLLKLAQEPVNKGDVFNDLENTVISGLTNIAKQSIANGKAVCQELRQFQVDHMESFPRLTTLQYRIETIEQECLNAHRGANEFSTVISALKNNTAKP
ncbi:caspase family protein [Chitinophaga sp. LS1]|uniref:caspase family protein n=1 Tax=Chitinophaga sp. LS1 TaxID=3051176 RepID=UPI002AAAFD51|nr:caspase family protein [Chitinophaga sp. LS1]WPV67046.1 caspase family protein [Chitinophaga sp. LS1]